MVFESIVVDLINKYLGDFVENLDKSQLKLGIWGGKTANLVGGVIWFTLRVKLVSLQKTLQCHTL